MMINGSFRKRLFAMFMVIGIIPLVFMGLFSYYNASNIINNRVNRSIEDNVEVMARLIDYSMENLKNMLNYVTASEDVQDVLAKKEYKSYEERFQDAQKIYKVTTPLLISQNQDFPIYISGVNNKYSRFSTSEYFANSYFDPNNDMFRVIDSSDSKPAFYIHRRVDGKARRDVVLSMGSQVNDMKSNSMLGHVVLDIYDDFFNEIFNKAKVYQGNNIYVLDQSGTIITDKLNKDMTGMKFYEEYLDKLTEKDSGTFTCNIKGTKYMAYFTTCSTSKLKVVEVVPMSLLYGDMISPLRIFLILLVILSSMAVLCSYVLSDNVSKPINRLSNLMKEVEKGNMDINFDETSDDEIGRLGRNFNKMVKEIKRLIDEVYRKQYLLKEAELKALKSQVNPHFLYNTLESINWMAKLDDMQGVSTMVTALGKFLRFSVSKQSDVTTVKEETTQLKNYLKIQEVRYKDKFLVEMDVQESMLEEKVPKLLLQPLVENAIIHGLEPKCGKGRLIVQGFLEDEVIHFKVMDDGIGFEDNGTKGEGIGLSNVNERIKMQYGEEYGVTLERQGEFTVSSLMVPRYEENLQKEGEKR